MLGKRRGCGKPHDCWLCAVHDKSAGSAHRRRVAISFVAGTLNCSAAFSIRAILPTAQRQMGKRLRDTRNYGDRLESFRIFHSQSPSPSAATIAFRPAVVILMRATSICRSPGFRGRRRAMASPLRTNSALLLLYFGSLGVPNTIRSWGGESEPEKRWRRRARLLVWVTGVPCAIIAVGCQTIITIYQ